MTNPKQTRMTLEEMVSRKALTDDVLTKIRSLANFIYRMLSLQKMTHDDVVHRLMNEPYNVGPEDLDLITIAFNRLSEADLLSATFETDRDNLTVKVLFRASLRKYRPEEALSTR